MQPLWGKEYACIMGSKGNGTLGRIWVTPQGFHKCSVLTPGGNYELWLLPFHPLHLPEVQWHLYLQCSWGSTLRCLACVGASGLQETEAVVFPGELPSSLSSSSDQVWLWLLLIQICGIGDGVPLSTSRMTDPRVC